MDGETIGEVKYTPGPAGGAARRGARRGGGADGAGVECRGWSSASNHSDVLRSKQQSRVDELKSCGSNVCLFCLFRVGGLCIRTQLIAALPFTGEALEAPSREVTLPGSHSQQGPGWAPGGGSSCFRVLRAPGQVCSWKNAYSDNSHY